MIPRNVIAALKRRAAAAGSAPQNVRCIAHLQARPPVVDVNAGTFASFYYKNIKDFETPTKDHMVDFGQEDTYTVNAFDRRVYSYALGLLEGLGLKKGQKIAVWMGEELDHLTLQYSAALVGSVVVEIDPKLGWDAVFKILKDEEVTALFLSPRFGAEDRFGKLAELFAAELAPAEQYGGYLPIQSKRLRSLKHIVCATKEFEEGVIRFRDLPVMGAEGQYETDDIAAVQFYLAKSDVVMVPYTAGPADGQAVKGKALTHADILASATAAAKALSLKSTDVVVSTVPLHNPLGLAAGALAPSSVTAKVVLPNKRFDAAKVLAAATQQRATVLVTVPEHVAALNDALQADAAKPAKKREYDLSTLRTGAVVGAAPGAGLSVGATKLSVSL